MKRDSRFFTNWKQKLFSLLFAVALSFYVSNMRVAERFFHIPLHIRNSPGFLIPVHSFPDSIKVTAKGRPGSLMVLDPQEINASVDLSAARPGLNTFFVDLRYPKQIEGLSVMSPIKHFRVRMDRVMVKRLPLRVRFINSPAAGFIRESYRLSPETVLVRGPLSVLTSLKELYCRPVNIGGLNRSTDRAVSPDFGEHNLSLQNPVSITLSIVVVPVHLEREFKAVAVKPVGLKNGLKIKKITPGSVILRLTGERTVVKDLLSEKVAALIDLSAFTVPGRYSVPVSIQMVRGIQSFKALPASVTVEIER